MCGREPNFELPEEEKQELRQFKWEEFLEMTRSAITHKSTYPCTIRKAFKRHLAWLFPFSGFIASWDLSKLAEHHRRSGVGSRRKSEPLLLKSDWESEQGGNDPSGSEEDAAAELDTSDS